MGTQSIARLYCQLRFLLLCVEREAYRMKYWNFPNVMLCQKNKRDKVVYFCICIIIYINFLYNYFCSKITIFEL